MTTIAERVLAVLADVETPEPSPDLVAPDAVTWHSFDEVEAPTVPDTVATLRAIRAVVPDFTMTEVRVGPADDAVAFVRYVIVGTLPDGGRLRAPATMAVHHRDGRATRLEEYVDTGQLAGLFAALG